VEEVLPALWGAPVAQGIEVAVNGVVSFAQRSAAYVREVRAEVRKVTWPTWIDLRRTTVVIVIFVAVVGVIIGLMDWVASKILIEAFERIFG